MLTLYTVQNDRLTSFSVEEARHAVADVIWTDMLNPTPEEESLAETLLGIEIPTREEMHEIELSARLYQENGIIYTTATLLTKADSPDPETHAVSFILSKKALITLRYSDPQPFQAVLHRKEAINKNNQRGTTVLVALLEAVIDRMADILERIGHNIDKTTRAVFNPTIKDGEKTPEKINFQAMLQQIGISGDSVSKSRESLVSISRLLSFLTQSTLFKPTAEEALRIESIVKDVYALSDHASFLSNKVNFLLDATLGMISIDQNATIKIFSVAAVVFLPPTLVASIYGMNFHRMPELDWEFGYPLAIGLMLLSAFLPWRYFKKKKWL